MKQVEKYIYIVLAFILVAVISSVTTYLIMKDNNTKDNVQENIPKKEEQEKNNKEEEPKEDSIKLTKTYSLNDKIVEEYVMTINGKEINKKITFNKEKDSSFGDYDNVIYGKINDNTVYSKFEMNDEDVSNVFKVNNIKQGFNENNFKFIKGEDNKTYLLVITNLGYNESTLLVFNDEFELLSKDIREDKLSERTGFNINYIYDVPGIEDESVWYPNNYNTKTIDDKLDTNIHIKIEDNKIYFLNPVFKYDGTEENYGYLEERVYTINNNELKYNVINTYKITAVGNPT